MEVSKAVQAGVVNLTNQKRQELENEYEDFQKYIQRNEDVELYSAVKQDATRYYDNIKEDKEYLISVRGQQRGAVRLGRVNQHFVLSEYRSNR